VPRLLRIAGPALLLLVALVSLIAALQFGGAAAAPLLSDPGPVVRWGLPLVTMIVNLSAAGAIGALVLACFALSKQEREFGSALDFAAGSAALWAVASLVTGFLTFLSVYQRPLSLEPAYGDLLATFFGTIPLGQAWLGVTLIAALVTVLCFAVRSPVVLLGVTVIAIAGLIPMAQQGHAAGTANHDAAVTSLGLHLIFAAIWLGGLLTIVIIRGTLVGGRIGPVISRYSTLALICFIAVASSGVVNAAIRVGSFSGLLKPYGILILVKAAALLSLGIFGMAQRRFLIERMQRPGGGTNKFFWWMVTAELGFMGLASGVAAALAKTNPLVQEVQITTTPAYILTGEPLPPPVSFARYFTEWRFDLLWILVIGFLAFFYLAGVWRLHRRGDSWPFYRTLLWLLGLAALFYVTNGGVNAYEKYLFSAHMLGHMILMMLVPILLVPGAPITLAMRAIHRRTDGSRGVREWLMLGVHSKPAAILTNPVVAAAIFAGSLWIFYYTPIFSWAITDHLGHIWMIVHFLLSGYLFVQVLIGVDPMPNRPSHPMKLIILLATMGFHAFFGVALMTGTGLLLSDWYGAMGWPGGFDALADQQAGGGIAWGIGEIPTAFLAIVVAIMWARSDERESRRLDRASDRSGNADLAEYNAMLARLNERNPRP